jgi:hypothetical protein
MACLKKSNKQKRIQKKQKKEKVSNYHIYGAIDTDGVATETNFDNELKKCFGEDGYELEYFEDEKFFEVTVKKSGRTYEIDGNGNITYLGLKTELELNIQITATPESYSEEKLVQNAEVKIKTALPVKLENTKLSYAWKIIDETDPDAEPESDEYIEETS